MEPLVNITAHPRRGFAWQSAKSSIFEDFESVSARLWAKVDIRSAQDCWIWKGSVGRNGYGQFSWARRFGRMRPCAAHRTAYELAHDCELATKEYVCHSCDTPLCCNPSHLSVGSQFDNMRDASQKGRLRVPRPGRHKLTPEQVEYVRAEVAKGRKQIELAREFDVTKGHINQLVHGKARRLDAPLAPRLVRQAS